MKVRKLIGAILAATGMLLGGAVFFTHYSQMNRIYQQKLANQTTVPGVLFQVFLLPTPTPPAGWTLLITGDVIPSRTVNSQMAKKNDFAWPLKNITAILQEADLTLINLEAPLLTNCPVTTEGMKFCGDARFAQALSDIGVDVANLANNHTLNHGWEGVKQTELVLGEVGIVTTGFTATVPASPVLATSGMGIKSAMSVSENLQTQKIAIATNCVYDSKCSVLTVKKMYDTVAVGFLGYNAVGQIVDRALVEQQIREADTQVDVLVVSVHWGREYVRAPQADPGLAPDDPKELGKLFIDWGADVVVGNHPHWYQGFEWVGDKPIFYALGNTVFDQEWSLETKVGFLAKLQFNGTIIVKEKLEVVPIGIRNYGEAYLLESNERDAVLEFLKTP